MTTYSLSSGLFVLDKEGKATGDPILALESIAAAGFRETELMAEGEAWKRPGLHDARGFREALNKFGIFAHTIHTPFRGVNLASADPEIRQEGIERIADAMRFGGEVGCRTAIVHSTGRPGEDEAPYTFENLGKATEIAYRSVVDLVRVAEETGVGIALENLPGKGSNCRPLVSMEELRAFIAGFPQEQVGLCLDTGHACISGLDPAEQADVASERLFALHIQDVDGQNDCHWLPGRGVIDWSALGVVLSNIGFSGAWTIEVLISRTEASREEVTEESVGLCERWSRDGMGNMEMENEDLILLDLVDTQIREK